MVFFVDVVKYFVVFFGGNIFIYYIVWCMFEVEGLMLNIVMSINYLEIIKMMVFIGLVWSVLLWIMFDDQVVCLLLQDIQFSCQFGYILYIEWILLNVVCVFMCLFDEQVFGNGILVV